MKLKKLKLNNRFDIIVKYLFVKSFESKYNFKYYKDFYLKHIKLWTWWIEDNKKNINDFYNNFIKLITNIKKKWFNKNYPIPINSKNEILNGAHRIATCLNYWIEPTFNLWENINWYKWDFNWFKKKWFSEQNLLDLLYTYCDLNKKKFSIVIIWPNILRKNINILKKFSKYNIIWDIEINIENKKNFQELILDIYSFDKSASKLWIKEKWNFLSNYWTNIKILLIENQLNDKEALRKKISEYSWIKDPKKSMFYTFHSSDTYEEWNYLKNILFSYNNIKHLRLRNFNERSLFLKRLNKLSKINKHNFCLVWSSSLELFNLVKTSDLDYITENPTNNWIIKINNDIDILDYQYTKIFNNKEIIINNNLHFLYRWIKFISLDLLKKIKLEWTREKDLQQSKLIERFLTKNKINKNNLFNEILYNIKYIITKIKIIFIKFLIFTTKKLKIYKYISFLWRKYILKNIYENKN